MELPYCYLKYLSNIFHIGEKENNIFFKLKSFIKKWD